MFLCFTGSIRSVLALRNFKVHVISFCGVSDGIVRHLILRDRRQRPGLQATRIRDNRHLRCHIFLHTLLAEAFAIRAFAVQNTNFQIAMNNARLAAFDPIVSHLNDLVKARQATVLLEFFTEEGANRQMHATTPETIRTEGRGDVARGSLEKARVVGEIMRDKRMEGETEERVLWRTDLRMFGVPDALAERKGSFVSHTHQV